MQGLTIFSHALRQVLGNVGMAVRISGWLALLYAALFGVILFLSPDWFLLALQDTPVEPSQVPDMGAGGLMLLLAGVIGGLVFFCWAVTVIAIAWHRFILLEEYPRGIIPYRSDYKIARYFWIGIGISVLAALVVGFISGILGMVFGPFFMASIGGAGQTSGLQFIGATFLIGMVFGLVVAVLYLRMALILPAIALNEDMKIGEAWEATSGYTSAIFVLALVLAFINVVVSIVIEMALSGAVDDWFYLAVSSLYQWFFFMLNISVLSTLYGHIVQKREIY